MISYQFFYSLKMYSQSNTLPDWYIVLANGITVLFSFFNIAEIITSQVIAKSTCKISPAEYLLADGIINLFFFLLTLKIESQVSKITLLWTIVSHRLTNLVFSILGAVIVLKVCEPLDTISYFFMGTASIINCCRVLM